MRIVLWLTYLLSVALAANIEMNPLSDEFINHINSKQNTWKAGRNFDKNMPIGEMNKRLGTLVSNLKSKIPTVHSEDIEIPESFDARVNWPKCSKVIGSIADQSECGSCWAVSSTSAMSDRRCIASGGSLQVPVSAEDLMSCCGKFCGNGCDGGYPEKAFDYWFESGIVTGGRYNSSLGCKPYSLQPCDSSAGGNHVECSTLTYDTPVCTKNCISDGLNYKSEETFGKSSAETFETIDDVQREILQNGPVTATFSVYEDFYSYKSGIYHYVAGRRSGLHTVRIIGWGTENNVDYWLVANSWNEDWGDNGLFKIKRGIDECGFENRIIAAQAKV